MSQGNSIGENVNWFPGFRTHHYSALLLDRSLTVTAAILFPSVEPFSWPHPFIQAVIAVLILCIRFAVIMDLDDMFADADLAG